jgi:plasmid rolling circle replication initiator protein Rep
MENSTDGIVRSCANEAQPFLTDMVADDAAARGKKENWDKRKNYSVQVQDVLATGERNHRRQAERMAVCAETLFYVLSVANELGETTLKFQKAHFCRVRNCPICQWSRSQMWVARFFQALPLIYAAYPTMRYAILTLTVQNCPISDLRPTIQLMNKAWHRLVNRKLFPAVGFVRSLEVTKEEDVYAKDKKGRKTKKLIHRARPNYCHPHFHILLALPASYFGANYLSTAKWAALWQDALKIDYTPICDIRMVKLKANAEQVYSSEQDAILGSLQAAICEVIKYTTKPADLVKDRAWTLELVNQLHNTRGVALGGIFKEFLKEEDDELPSDADDQEQDQTDENATVRFRWRPTVKRYQRLAPKE